MFKKILIANRGEIALRVIHACRELGIPTVAVYSEADEHALHVRFADEEVCIGPPRPIESYLNVPAIISAAEITGADAIHPGYGFLSESSYLAEAAEACGITFVGPPPSALRLLGDKARARRAMRDAGLPVLPGSEQPPDSLGGALKAAKKLGYPLILKATAGGGGRGMRIVREPDEFEHAWKMAQQEASAAFGNGSIYLEKYVEAPRHIEFQVLADDHGHVVHLGERECSIQRRHQKLVEECPSTVLTERQRRKLGKLVADAAERVGYRNAGTFEFLMDDDGKHYFLEANTRLQVEHPVTEMVTGEGHRQGADSNCRRSADLLQPEGSGLERACDRVPDQRRVTRHLSAEPRVAQGVQHPGRGRGFASTRRLTPIARFLPTTIRWWRRSSLTE